MKQRGSHIKGDWFRMLLKDFQFIEQDMDDNAIKNTPKGIYSKEIKKKVNAGALKYFIQIKEQDQGDQCRSPGFYFYLDLNFYEIF